MKSCHAQRDRLTHSHLKTQNFPTRAANKSKPMHIPVQIGHGLIFMKNATWSCQISNMRTCANYCMALPQKRHPQYQSGKCHTNTEVAVSGTFNAVTAWPWHDSDWCDWKGAGVDANAAQPAACSAAFHSRSRLLTFQNWGNVTEGRETCMAFLCLIWDVHGMRAHLAQLQREPYN